MQGVFIFSRMIKVDTHGLTPRVLYRLLIEVYKSLDSL